MILSYKKKEKEKEDLKPDKICVSIFVSPSSLVTCNMQYEERKITKWENKGITVSTM